MDKSAFEWTFSLYHGSNVQKEDGITRIAGKLGCCKRNVKRAVKALLQSHGIRWGQPTQEQVRIKEIGVSKRGLRWGQWHGGALC